MSRKRHARDGDYQTPHDQDDVLIKLERAAQRRFVLAAATKVIKAVRDCDAQLLADFPFPEEYAPAPPEVPTVTQRGELGQVVADGTVGQYFAGAFPDVRSSDSFNAGFYAGVLAAKLDLVDLGTFHEDPERQ